MFNFKKKNKKGFTLTEMLVVVLIISVLAAISSPIFLRAVERTRAAQGLTTLQDIAKAQTAYNAKRGRYAVSLLPLPLDLKDKEGQDVYGAAFSDRFFDFTVYGDDQAQAVADRSTGRYQLSIDYATGKLYCNPSEEYICQSLGLESKDAPITSCKDGDVDCYRRISYTGNYCRKVDNITECINYENGIDVSSCYLEWGYCKGGFGYCIMNDDGSGCAETDFSGFKCFNDFKERLCINFENGRYTFTCWGDDVDCLRENKATGVVCPPKGSGCVIYSEGDPLDTCPVNQTGDGCLKNAMVCNTFYEDVCVFTGENGTEVGSCAINKSGDGCYGEIFAKPDYTGTLCDTSQGICFKFKNGEKTGTCTSNAAGTGCTNMTLNCENGTCTMYRDGVATDISCPAGDFKCYQNEKLTGDYCDPHGGCYHFENGEQTLNCDAEYPHYCEILGGGSCLKSNTGVACAKNELVCVDDTCYNFDDNGQEVFHCPYGNMDCFSENNYTGVACGLKGTCANLYEGEVKSTCNIGNSGKDCAKNELVCDGKNCYSYDEQGNLMFACGNSDGRCFEDNKYTGAVCDDKKQCQAYENGVNMGSCIANNSNTACAKMTVSCDKEVCEIYKDGLIEGTCDVHHENCLKDYRIDGTVCDGGDCITYNQGQATLVCAKEKCYIYENDRETGQCIANDSGKACAKMTMECEKGICEIYKDGVDTGATCNLDKEDCYSTNYITGQDCSGSYCINYGNGRVTHVCKDWCNLFDDQGNETGTCVANAENSGCAQMTAECNEKNCTLYKDGKDAGVTFDYNDSYMYDKYQINGVTCQGSDCSTYENGKLTYRCDLDVKLCNQYNEKGEMIGKCLKSNNGNTCAKNEFACDKDRCYNFGANEESVFSCAIDDIGCYVENNFNGTACNNGRCYTFEYGSIRLDCRTGVCYDRFTKQECPSNEAGTACAE